MCTLYKRLRVLFFVCVSYSQLACWNYRNIGNVILDLDINHKTDETIIIRGRYIANRGRNGFKLFRNRSSDVPDIALYNKDLIPPSGSMKSTTILRVKNLNNTSYFKYHFNESTYSQESDIIYQMTFGHSHLTLRINNNSYQITTLSGPSIPDRWNIEHIDQIGDSTIVKEVSVCPLMVESVILEPGSRVMQCVTTSGKCGARSPHRTLFIGEEVELRCLVTGVPPLLVWWMHDEEDISNGISYRINKLLYQTKTVVSSKLNFFLGTNTEGQFSCHGANKYDASLQWTSTISISGYLSLTSYILEPKYVVAQAGSSVSFTCHVDQWPRVANVTWQYLNGKILPNKYTVEKTRVEKSVSDILELKFTDVAEKDSGVFTCGRAIASLYVEAEVTDVDAMFNKSTAEFTCSTRATPAPTFELTLAYHEHEREDDEVGFVIKSVKRDDGVSIKTWLLDPALDYFVLRFTCTAKQIMTSRAKKTVETSGFVHITKPLEINIRLLNVSTTNVISGDDIAFQCTVIGNPSPAQIMIIKDGEIIRYSNNPSVHKYVMQISKSLTNVTWKQEGLYKCAANNSFEHIVSETIKINVFEKASIALQVNSVHQVVNNTIRVPQGRFITVECASIGGFPPPQLIISHNGSADQFNDSDYSRGHHDNYLQMQTREPVRETVLVKLKKVVVKCQGWQSKFGEEVSVEEDTLTLIPEQVQHPVTVRVTLYSSLALLGVLLFILLLVGISLSCRRHCHHHQRPGTRESGDGEEATSSGMSLSNKESQVNRTSVINDKAEKNVFRSQNLADSKTNDRRSSSFSWPPDKSVTNGITNNHH